MPRLNGRVARLERLLGDRVGPPMIHAIAWGDGADQPATSVLLNNKGTWGWVRAEDIPEDAVLFETRKSYIGVDPLRDL